MQPNLGPDHDLALRLTNLESAVASLQTRDVLQNASIGVGGLTVNGGTITITGGGSLVIQGTGTFTTNGNISTTGAFSASTTITAGTDITAGGAVKGASITATGTVQGATVNSTGAASVGGSLGVTGDVNVTGNVFVPNSTIAVSGYTIGYINGDGRLSKGASAARYKQDFEPVDNTPLAEAIFRATLLRFHLIAAVEELGDAAVLEIGLLADYLDTIGLSEFVYRDEKGEPLGIQYERLTIPLIAAVQNLNARLKAAGL